MSGQVKVRIVVIVCVLLKVSIVLWQLRRDRAEHRRWHAETDLEPENFPAESPHAPLDDSWTTMDPQDGEASLAEAVNFETWSRHPAADMR